MSQTVVAPLEPAELPDWILALKPSDADVAEPAENIVFSSLDAKLESLAQVNPDDVTWLAEVAEERPVLMSEFEAAAILEGKAKPARLRARRRRPSRWRRNELIILDAILFLMVLAVLMVLLALVYAGRLP
jgi:hypothetical protein